VPVMSRGKGNFYGEDITVQFTARGQLVDHGVDGSPSWIEWSGVKIEELKILGQNVDPKILPDDLVKEIYGLTDHFEFELEEPDHD
jgi:hypothetical protein